jgi:DNA-binding NarL/FixJ family response regulator
MFGYRENTRESRQRQPVPLMWTTSPRTNIGAAYDSQTPKVLPELRKLGAYRYLLKSDTSDLALAVEAVLGGEQFVSSRLRVP